MDTAKVTSIPPKIDEVFRQVRNEVIWLHGRWIVFRQLFGKSPERIDLLNECASNVFRIMQDTMLDDIQLALSKLTDPQRTTASLKTLHRRVETHGDLKRAAALKPLIVKLDAKCAAIRKHRDKRLAHLDLDTAMQVAPLPPISRAMIEDALSTVREYMNGIERHYDNNETA